MTARITQDEEAILRSWLAGNEPRFIARARAVSVETVHEALISLCDLKRDVGRRVLESGRRRQPARRRGDVDQAEAQRVQRVVDEVLLDHSPAVTAVVDAARALYRALLCDDVTWYRAPWAEMTAVGEAIRALDKAPAAQLPEPIDGGGYQVWSCTECPYIGPDDDHGDDHPGGADLLPMLVILAPREVT